MDEETQKRGWKRMTEFKDYIIGILKNQREEPNGKFGYQFMRITPYTVILFAWVNTAKQKTQIEIRSKEKKPNEVAWENLYPEYEWVNV